MKDLSCAAARHMLEAYHDEELSVREQIAMDAHLERCGDCSAALQELADLRDVFRVAAPGRAPLTNEERHGFHASVVNRVGAENTLSWSVLVRDMFDDMHFVYAGLGAAASVVICVVITLNMMRFASGPPPGSNQNPVIVDVRMLMPRLDQGSYSSAGGPEAKSDDDDAAFTVSAVVTREGRVVNLELHPEDGQTLAEGSSEARAVQDMLGAMSQARFEPARVGGLPVAVNMVWLVRHMTVRAAKMPSALPATPAAKKRRVVDPIAFPVSRKTVSA